MSLRKSVRVSSFYGEKEGAKSFASLLWLLLLGVGSESCTGPKWPKRGPFRSILVKMTLFRTGFWILAFARPKWTKMVHFGPIWPEEVHLGPFRSANRTLAIPEPLTAEEIAVIRIAAISSC